MTLEEELRVTLEEEPGMVSEDELCNTVTPPMISSSAEASFAVIFIHSPFWQRRKSLPTASATQPSSLSSQTFSPLPSARVITSPFSPFVTELEEPSSPQATRPKVSAKATLVKKFFFIFHFLAKISASFKNSLCYYAE